MTDVMHGMELRSGLEEICDNTAAVPRLTHRGPQSRFTTF